MSRWALGPKVKRGETTIFLVVKKYIGPTIVVKMDFERCG